jgi:NAD(P)-dependent dehydrogenase (short-subunit alcohol dehydrogenase family)
LASDFDLRERVVILTGGAGLLGSEYARALVEAGAQVVIADLDSRRARRLAASLSGGPGRALAFPVDVADHTSVRRLVRRVLRVFRRIDGLVNNAALDPKFDPREAGRHTSAFEDFPLDLWNQGLAVNLTGMFLCSQAVAPAMLGAGRGVIVNVSSTYGLVGPDQRLYENLDPGGSRTYKPVVYSVTKSAVIGFTRYLAAYWAGKGIRVNALTPGGVYDGHSEEFVRRYSSRTPLGRMADKSEYCGALLFLLSDASSYMTGANLVIDGGWTAW